MASPFFRVALGAGLVLAVTTGSLEAAPQTPGPAPLVDSARAEMAMGRYWHASRLLRRLDRELDPRATLLLARAEAGYANWSAAVELLGGASWLDDVEDGAGWLLLGRAQEEEGRPEAAATAYRRYLASPAARTSDATWARARLGRTLAAAGDVAAVAAVLDSLYGQAPELAAWSALELADPLAADGDTAALRPLLALVDPARVGEAGWDLQARALLSAGDSVGGEAAYREAVAEVEAGSRTARAWTVVGRIRLAAGDTAAALEAFQSAVDGSGGTPSGAEAAGQLVELGALDAERALPAAWLLSRAGESEQALAAYDLHLRVSPDASEGLRLARARLLAVTPGRQAEAVDELRALSASESVVIGAGALDTWMDLRRRQGRTGDVATLRQWLVERYPSSPQAVEVVYLRGDAAQDRGDLDTALEHYARLQEMNPELDRSGQARMRTAQILLGRGDREGALAVWEGYLADFPRGRRWDEAAFWAGKTLLDVGRGQEGVAHLRDIVARAPFSYYAVRAAEELSEPFTLPPLPQEGPLPFPQWLRDGLAEADRLGEAGLVRGRAVAVERLTSQARATSPAAVLRLARELIRRGMTIEGIRLGLEVRDAGHPWTRALLEIVYPLPYREMVERVAQERGVDPAVVAAIIRQESAYDSDIVSAAGAVGLMQVMPPTGRELARSEGPRNFSRASLDAPEINLHLGTRFFRDMSERYDGQLPLVLSAYNAGPTRATRWRTFPEAADPLRFIERIPFPETRDYVKQVTRYIALYRALYWAE